MLSFIKQILIRTIQAQDTETTISFGTFASPFEFKYTSTEAIIDAISDIIFVGGMLLFVVIIIIGGIIFITAGVSVENAKKGFNWIKAGVIGVIVILLAKIIFELVKNVFL